MALYERVEGVPQLRDSLVAYIDVLGVQDAYRHDAETTARVLNRALRRALTYVSQNTPNGGGYAGSAVHDSITLGMPWEQDRGPLVSSFAVQGVQLLQASLSVMQDRHINGLFTRGALATGSHFVDPDFVGGLALACAVAAEGADGPWRHRPVVQVLSDTLPRIEPNKGPIGALAWCDEGAFVNYLAGFSLSPAAPGGYFLERDSPLREGLSRHQTVVANNVERFKNEVPAKKYRWLSGYHNAFCQRLGLDEFAIPNQPADSRIRFVGPDTS